MRKRRLFERCGRLLIVSAALVVGAMKVAHADDCCFAILAEMSGQPAIHEITASGLQRVSLPVSGARYQLPLEVETGAQDSATFVLPNSTIEIAPRSVMRIVAPEPSGQRTLQRILQRAGSSLFKVQKGTVDGFTVETPYLVSVVKGTTFNVLVHDHGATVALHEGRLDVLSLDAQQLVNLVSGEFAFAERGGVVLKLESEFGTGPRSADGGASVRSKAIATLDKADSGTRTTVASKEGTVKGDDGLEVTGSAGESVRVGTEELTTSTIDVVSTTTEVVLVPDSELLLDPVIEPLADPVIEPLMDPLEDILADPIDSKIDTSSRVMNVVTESTGISL